MSRTPLTRVLYLLGGLVALALAGIGVALPVLPTTPLLLLAAACFVRSSERLHDWMYTNRWFGDYLARYGQHRAISRRHRIVTLVLLWAGLGASILFAVETWWPRGLLAAIGVGVTVHLVTLNTWDQ